MKLTLIIIFLSVLQVSANVYSQVNVNLDVREKSVRDVLKSIEQQSQVRFFYSDDMLLYMNDLINVKAENKNILDVLDEIFKRSSLAYKAYDNNLIVIAPKALLQQQKVTGTITDATSGEALVGVNVVIEGTTIGVITDINGKYSIPVPNLNGVLQISYIGYATQKVPINGTTVIDVKLTSNVKALEDVVVVGYGTQKKINVTGSVATVSSKEMSVLPVKDLGSALIGKLPGLIMVNPGGAPGDNNTKVKIRGFESMLVIVDGVEYPFDWSQLETCDIENVSILKDAAASIYGARAGNGVLLITTKRGKTEKPVFNVTASKGYETPIFFNHTVDAPTYAKIQNELGKATWTPEQIEKFRNGTDPAYPNTDWFNEVFKKWSALTHVNLNSSGGNEMLNYYFSLGYFKNDGMLRSGDLNYNRINFTTKVEAKIARGFTASLDIFARQQDIEAPGSTNSNLNMNVAYYQLLQETQMAEPTFPAHYPDPTKLTYSGHGSTQPIGRSSKAFAGYTNNDDKFIDAKLTLKYDAPFLNGLTAKTIIGSNNEFRYQKQFGKKFDYWDYNRETNTYSNPQPAQSAFIHDRESMGRFSQLSAQTIINYEKTIGEHSINAMVLGEWINYNSNDFFAFRKNYVSPAVEQLFAGGDEGKDANGTAATFGRIAYAGRLNYVYAGKYMGEITVRRDASSVYSPDNRWGTFPSVSIGWRLSEEQFLKNKTALNNLKLRASIGKAGSDASVVDPYSYLSGYNYGYGTVFGNQSVLGLLSKGLSNPNLKWQTSTNYNIGLDAGLWKNKLSFEFDYFYRKVVDVPGYRVRSIPFTFGAGLPYEAINSYDNRGFELVVRHENTINNIKYSVMGMLSNARSKWIKFDEHFANDVLKNLQQNTGQWRNRTIAYEAAGLFQTQAEIDSWADQDGQKNASIKPGDIKYVDVNKDGVIDNIDQHNIGKGSEPEMVFGLNLRVEYKGFDLTADFQGASGFNVYHHSLMYDNSNTPFEYMTDYWTPTNTGAKFPRLFPGEAVNNQKVSSYWLKNASYLRLHNLTLGYSIPKRIINKLHLNSSRLYVAASELFTLTSKDMVVDPESGINNYGEPIYPRMRNIQVGLEFNF